MSRLPRLHTLLVPTLLAAPAGCFPTPPAGLEDAAGAGGDLIAADTSLPETSEDASESLSDADEVDDAGDVPGDHGGGEDVPVTPGGATSLTTASTDEGVLVTWQPAPAALRQQLDRCRGACDADGPWAPFALQTGATTYLDVSAEPAPAPGGPTGLTASTDDPDAILVTWDPMSAPEAPFYTYRVTSYTADGPLPSSALVRGARATPALSAWAWSVDDGANWNPLAPDATQVSLGLAGPPTVKAVLRASEGTAADAVQLILADLSLSPGSSVKVLVRAETTLGEGAPSTTTGWRAAPVAVSVAWERSEFGQDGPYAAIGQPAEQPVSAAFGWRDTTAPDNGAVRFYRAVISGTGMVPWTTTPVAGWRTPPLGVPANVQASDDLADLVRVTWEPVPGATQYEVLRDGTVVDTVLGLMWEDRSAPAPIGGWTSPSPLTLTARTEGLQLNWTAPARPLGAARSYAVRAVGSNQSSAPDTGRRAAASLAGWEIVVARGGVSTTVTLDVANTQWIDTNAPPHTLGVSQVSVTNGARRAAVTLNGAITVARPVESTYTVRGRLATTPSTATATSNEVKGTREMGSVAYAWLRSQSSAGSSAYDVVAQGQGTTLPAVDDSTAPADGAKRYYKLTASADGATTASSVPTLGWRLAFAAITAGGRHACAISTEGALWCWGARDRKQLGTGALTTPVAQPLEVATAGTDPVVSASAGQAHTCFVRRSGSVACFGSNDFGECGVGGVTTVESQTVVPGLTGAISVSAGNAFTCAVVSARTDRQVRCWGQDKDGQLGAAFQGAMSQTPLTVVTSSEAPLGSVSEVHASVSGTHACAFTPTEAYCWGRGGQGQLGLGSTTPTTDRASLLEREVVLKNPVSMAVGGSHTLGLIAAGELTGWGLNTAGQCGDSGGIESLYQKKRIFLPTGYAATTVVAGTDHSCALTGDRRTPGDLLCWGGNARGQLGLGTTVTMSLVPTRLDRVTQVTAAAAGNAFSCAVSNGGLMCWGTNDAGQSGGTVGTAVILPTALVLP